MFAARFYNRHAFAARYFPKTGGAAAAVTYVRSHRYAIRPRRRIYVVTE